MRCPVVRSTSIVECVGPCACLVPHQRAIHPFVFECLNREARQIVIAQNPRIRDTCAQARRYDQRRAGQPATLTLLLSTTGILLSGAG